MEEAFNIVNIPWQDHVTVDKRFSRPLDVNYLLGDYSNAQERLGWKPKIKFHQLVEMMVQEDLSRWRKWQKGEHFPRDASHYVNEARIITRSLKV